MILSVLVGTISEYLCMVGILKTSESVKFQISDYHFVTSTVSSKIRNQTKMKLAFSATSASTSRLRFKAWSSAPLHI